MKALLSTDFLPSVKQDAKKIINADRASFRPILLIIEEYCEKHRLILSDHKKLSEQSSEEEFQPINVYTVDPLRHANNMANEIYLKQITKTQDAKFTKLKTMQEKKEFAIEYYFRNVAFVHRLQKFGKGEPMRLINPVRINRLLYMPAELELIDLYHQLSDVSKTDDFEENLEAEKKLFAQVIKRKQDGVLGGGMCGKKNREIDFIKLIIAKKFLGENDKKFVLIGSWAADWIVNGDFCGNREKIQIIGGLNAKTFEAKLRSFLEKQTDFALTYREQKLHIPKDFRTTRRTFYLKIGGKSEKPFLDYFNVMEFEIVPAILEKKILIGTRELMLRFMFIDLWILGVIREISQNFETKDKIHKLWLDVQRIRSFQYDENQIEFLGTHRDFMVDKKLKGLGGKMFYPYYPHLQKERTGELRTFEARN
jgi:hypothetical protein